MKTVKNTILCLATFAIATAANAISIDISPNGALAGMTYVDFDAIALGNAGGTDKGVSVTFTGNAKTVNGSVSGQYAAPFVSSDNGTHFGNPFGTDTTNYLSSGTGSVILEFAGEYDYFGLLWGSVDTYNSLSFYNGASLVKTFTGNDVFGSPNGDRGVNGTAYVNIMTETGFNRVVASATSNAFEFDNVAYGNVSVPDSGSTLALLGLGLLGTIALRRKNRR